MTPVKVEAEEVLEYADYLTSTAAEEARYATRRGDYYLGSEVAPADGVWHELGVGGAQVLGLDGQRVTREALVPVWRNQHPVTAEQLVREGADGSHVAGVDMTFSPPKDFSILWALADERERALLEQVWARSVRQALEHVLREIPLIRRGRGGCIRETAAAIQAAEFVHHTARVTEEAARDGAGADPQVHSHVVISNVARRHDGRLAAIASHPIMAHQHEIGAIQSATLAALLREQGYEVVPRGDAWAIAGISDRTRDWFSKREAEVLRYEHEDALRRGRPLTKAERRAAVKASRGKKDVNPEGDFVRWLEEEIALAMSARDAAERGRRVEEIVREARRRRDAAAASGLDVVGLTLGPARPKDAAGLAAAIVKDLTAPQPTAIGTLGPDKLTADSAVFDELELRKGIARGMQAVQATALDFGAIRDAVHRARELTRIDPRTRDPLQAHWTTTRHLETERRVLGELEARARRGGHGIGSGHVEAAIAGSRYVLSTEQRAATRACCDAHGLRLVAAEAGTGKGKGVGRAVADAYRSAGYRIVAVSTAGQTADEFGRDVAAAETRTIDSLARRGEPLPHDTLVLVDEGGQVDTVGRWTGLLDVLGEAKCVVLGDERQLSAVTPGGIFATAQRTVPTSRLTEVHRHPDPEVVAIWRLIRNGQGERAARELYERGMLALEPDRPAVIDRLVRRWEAQHLDGDLLDVALLTDTTNREVDLLNRRIQARREELGELLGTPVPVRWQDPQVRSYVREEALRTGDAVKTVRSVWLGRARELVRNGEVGRVTATRVDGSAAQVRFGDRVLWFGPRERDSLRLAYATHQQSGQGMTVDAVGGLLGGLRTTRLEGAYVQASRSRRDALLVADLDTLQVPEEVVAVPAGEVWAEQRERLSWEQRVALGLKALGELLSTSDAKETAIDALAREEARERAARELEEREGRAQLDLSSVAPPTHTPATPKQLAYAAAVGAEVPDFATWVEASVAIDAATAAEPGSWVRQLLAERGVVGGLVDDAVDLAAQRTGVPPPSVATTGRSQPTATANGIAQAPVVSGTEPWHGVPGIDERRELAGVPREAVTDGAELRVGEPRLMARSAGMGREATDGDGRVREERRWTSYDTLSPADRAATDAMAEGLRARLRTVAGGYLWERYRRELDDPGLASLPRLLRNPVGMDADTVAREIGDRLEQVERLEEIWDGIRAALDEGSVRLGDGGHAGEEVTLWSNLLCAALPLAEDPGLRPALAGMIVDLASEVGPPVVQGWIERRHPAVEAWAGRLRETGIGAVVLEERAARDARVRELDRRWRGALEGAWGEGHEAVWEALIAEVAPHRDDPVLGPAAAGLVAEMARAAGGPVVGDGFERLAPAEVAWAKGLAGAAGQEDGMGVIGTARERLEMDR
ncbi:MAG TPA: MobF family relaxase, partial [Candidatus Dormibacteraeota bacterium]